MNTPANNKTQILKKAAPTLPARPHPVNAGTPTAIVSAIGSVSTPVVAQPPVPPTDDQIIANTAAKQHAAIVENLRRAKIAQAAQAKTEALLKADGISLDDLNAAHLAQQRLAELEQQTQMKAADVAGKALFKTKYGVEFQE